MKNSNRAYWKGKKRPEHSKKMTGKHWKQRLDSKSGLSPSARGEAHPRWQLDESKLSQKGLLWRVKAKYGLRPANCEECNEPGAFINGRYSINYVNVDGNYKSTDISDWKRLCPPCKYSFLFNRRNVKQLLHKHGKRVKDY